LRDEGKNLLVLDSGDLLFLTNPINERTREQSLKKAEQIIRAFNIVGCDALNIGDNDLAEGKEYLLERAEESNFPFISANLIDTTSGRPLLEPYIIREVDGLRVGIFGLVTHSVKLDMPDLLIDDPYETAKRIVDELKGKCDLVIALTHLGVNNDKKLAQQVPGINIIVGGHSSSKLETPLRVNDTIILQAYLQGRYLGRLDLTIYNGSLDFFDAMSVSIPRNILDPAGGQVVAEVSADNQNAPAYSDVSQEQKQDAERSQYINALVIMDENIDDEPEVQELVDEYRKDLMEILRARAKAASAKTVAEKK
jgi:2',3'-cyclic-nucleotide 2'-phosphodiesterase (5'-nucleotidase family)